MVNDKLPQTFRGKRSKHNDYICDCCHGLGYVVKFEMPITLYYDGKHLTTRYKIIWICDECRIKLIDALQNPVMEELIPENEKVDE